MRVITFLIFSLFLLLSIPVCSAASEKTYNGTFNQTEVGGDCIGGHTPDDRCLSSLYQNIGYTSFLGEAETPSNFVLTFEGEVDKSFNFKNDDEIQCTGEPATKNGVKYLKNATCKLISKLKKGQLGQADDGVGSKAQEAFNKKKNGGSVNYTDNSLLGTLFGNAFSIKIFPTEASDDPRGKNTAFYVLAMQAQNLLFTVVGILFVIMFIVGGILYITSAGNEQRITKGKTYLTYAVWGLVLIVLAEVLVNTIVGLSGTFTGETTLSESLGTIKTYLLGGVGFLAVLFIIIGGGQLIMARGNPDQMTKAKKTLTYSIAGLIVVLLAEVVFVLVNAFLNSAVK